MSGSGLVDLNTTLLRERFVIRELQDSPRSEQNPSDSVTALSNRLVVPLIDAQGDVAETFVIRSKIMHMAVRMAACIIRTYSKSGPLMSRGESFDFSSFAEEIFSPHDLKFNPDMWLCVYHKAEPVYEYQKRHSFLDVIEKCDLKNRGNYDNSVAVAEDIFKKMGRNISISHSANIGMVVNITKDAGRCGLILRNPHKTTTFNYVAEKKPEGDAVHPSACLEACADFLEGIQLAVRVGMINQKRVHGLIAGDSPEIAESTSAKTRLEDLSRTIQEFESLYEVRYRLERPDFKTLTYEAEIFQKQLIKSGGTV